MAVAERLQRFMRTIETGDAIVAPPSARIALRLAAPVPSTWLGFAQALFPNSSPMTGDERRAFDATAWPDLEAIDIVDD